MMTSPNGLAAKFKGKHDSPFSLVLDTPPRTGNRRMRAPKKAPLMNPSCVVRNAAEPYMKKSFRL